MASLNEDNKGHLIRFRHPITKQQKKIRLGTMTKRARQTFFNHVEHLISALAANIAPPASTSAWVGGLGQQLKENFIERN